MALKSREIYFVPKMMFIAGEGWNLSFFVAAVVVYEVISFLLIQEYFDGLVQERRNSIANALELRLSCTNPLILCCDKLLSKVLMRVIFNWKWHDAVTGSLAKYV